MRREGIMAVEAVHAGFRVPADADEPEILTDREVDLVLVAVGHDHRPGAVAAGNVVETQGRQATCCTRSKATICRLEFQNLCSLFWKLTLMSRSTDGSAQAGSEASKGSSRRSAGVISRAIAGALNIMQEMKAASHFIRMLQQVFGLCSIDHVGDP